MFYFLTAAFYFYCVNEMLKSSTIIPNDFKCRWLYELFVPKVYIPGPAIEVSGFKTIVIFLFIGRFL